MSVKVKAVTTDGIVHDIPGGYGDMDDACGDTRGDLWDNIHQAIGDCEVAELRFVTTQPIKLNNRDDQEDLPPINPNYRTFRGGGSAVVSNS